MTGCNKEKSTASLPAAGKHRRQAVRLTGQAACKAERPSGKQPPIARLGCKCWTGTPSVMARHMRFAPGEYMSGPGRSRRVLRWCKRVAEGIDRRAGRAEHNSVVGRRAAVLKVA